MWVFTALVVLPMFVAAGTLAARGWHPTSDLAQAELRMQAFWSAPPEIGAAGRIGDPGNQGAHPGPAAWWALYPVYALGGSSPGALSVSVATVAAAFAAASIWVAHRLGGVRAALCVGVCLAITIRALGPTPFVEPWNPYLGIFPFALFLMGVWGVVVRRPLFLVPASFAGSFAVQQHVGYIPLVAALGAAAAVIVALGLRREPRRAAALSLAGAAGAAALLWMLPLREQMREPEGNLTVIWNSFGRSTEEVIGVGPALRVVAGIFGAIGTWAVRSDVAPLDRSAWISFAVLALGWLAAAIGAGRRRDRSTRWRVIGGLHLVVAAALVVGTVATSRIFGEVFDYLLEWMRIIAATAAAATLWTAWEAGRESGTTRRAATIDRAVAGGVGVVLILVTSWSVVTFPDVETPGRRLSDQMGELAAVSEELDVDDSYVVRWSDPVALGALGFGTVLELERAGFDVGADPVFATAVLPSRVMRIEDADRSLWVVSGDRIEAMRTAPGVVELAHADVRTPAERRRVEALREVVRTRLEEAGGEELSSKLDLGYWNVILDPDYPEDLADEIAELGDLGLPTSIFAAPPEMLVLPE